ncbi:MAG: helix-turn-helix transcriptional regulator [Clostridia bacterium]|nr:helix-turn-helix transcriptional regulator [Clostridia bacterium]
MNENIYVSELSSSKHIFQKYHFCRGNSNKRKSRFGIILRGSGTYIYLGKKLKVTEGDVVFIPENICCYSEWYGDPEIEVLYLSCFMHYETFKYEPQLLYVDDTVKHDILQITELLSGGQAENLEAYSRFYKLLQTVIVKLKQTDVEVDKTLQTAMEYIMANYNSHFSVAELAKTCCVSESTLYHLFQRVLGLSPISFLNSVRINMAIEFLERSEYSISTISREVGFNSENYFRKVFAEFTGTTPLKYKKETLNP